MQAETKPANQSGHPTEQMKSLFSRRTSRTRLRLRVLLGKLRNLAGVPGLVRDCDYQVGIASAHVKVRVCELFTVIEVNGMEIFFHRLTGAIDGIGVITDCKSDSVPELGSAPVPADSGHHNARKRTA